VSIVVAIPFGVGSAVVYGSSIVVQHRVAQHHADDGERASAAGLLRLIRNPVWLLAIAGDALGFVLQVVALSTGPVVVIQPLVVLMLPVSLFVSAALGWHVPRPGDYLGVLGVLSGLAVFLVLIGKPGAEHIPRPQVIGLAIALVALCGVVACLAVAGRNRVVRGAVYGGVAGIYFGTLAVMVDAASERAARAGLHGLLATPKGLIPLIGGVTLGVGGMVLTQMSFQIGTLAATLPTNLATDPLMGVVLGEVLLRERIPLSAWHLLVYALCVVAVVAGAVRLAAAEDEIEPAEPTR
jgi:drug/metabolite transporter (DMT)-like permease